MKKTMKRTLLMGALFTSLLTVQAQAHTDSKISADIQAAVNSKARVERQTKRDARRKPAEVMAILGVKPGMKILDLTSGGGYYTEILSRVVGDKGQVIAHNPPFVVNRFAAYFTDEKNGWPAQLNAPQWKKNVVKMVGELDTADFGVQIDAVLMVLFYHDTVWQGVNRQMMNQHIYNAIKPGGTYLIIDHSAKPGNGTKDTGTHHRIDKQTVIDELTAVGFELTLDSDILSNPKDTRDYSFERDVRTNRDNTDRMVLKFVKPVI
ncbi:MAG: class I SAM-dependent methyltransferase [Algicola sp.]|nr:class I SAM-dependent methyltransferase [Algicola sp.]